MSPWPPIALVGLPGSGKSTVGRQLARRLRLDFIDLDAAIEAREGCSIRELFARAGEAAFRDVETEVLREWVQRPGLRVLSTGGGIVLRPANRELLQAGCTVVYLRTSVDELARRLRHDTQRPLLQVANPRAKLAELFEQRDPLYQATAHFVIASGRPSVGAVAGIVQTQLELAGRVPLLPPEPVPPAPGA